MTRSVTGVSRRERPDSGEHGAMLMVSGDAGLD